MKMETTPFMSEDDTTHDSTKKQKYIDSSDTNWAVFYVLFIATEVVGALCIILVVVLVTQYMGGFAWDGSKEMFNYHPVFMVTGMVVLYGNSAIAYRIFRRQNKFAVKLLHAALHLSALIFAVVGLYAVFKFHITAGYGNMYSIHSWFGMGAVVLFCCQYLFGFLGFLYPKCVENQRRYYLKTHVYFGGVILALAIVACVSGITEQMLFKFKDVYSKKSSVGIIANSLGVCLALYAMLVGFILYNTSYKRSSEN